VIGLDLARLVLVWMAILEPAAPWLETYADTASAIASACEARPAFGTPLRCAAILTALGYHESRFNPDAVGKAGELGVWQIAPSWHPPKDLDGRARMAVWLVEESTKRCHDRPMLERLGWYASGGGTCGRPATSRIRMALALALLR